MYLHLRLCVAILALCPSLFAQALAIRTDELPVAIKGLRYEARIATYTNGRCPEGDVTLTLAGGQLPRGVELSSAGLEGTPGQIGVFRFSVRASNNCQKTTKVFDFVVTGKPILVASPSQVAFQCRQGSSERPEDVIQLEGSSPDLPYSYNISAAPWLSADASIGRTPDRESTLTGDRIHLKVDPTNLAPGHYQGAIKFYTRGGENAPVVRVTLDVTKTD